MKFENLVEINQLSETGKSGALIFKHSTRCALSSMVLNRFSRAGTSGVTHLSTYLLDINCFRELSHEVSQRFGVVHQSPQILLIKNGQCVYHASHNAIRLNRVMEEIAHG